MNVFIPDGRIDQFILEDMPYIDLTTEVLGIGEEPGEIEYFTREDCVLAGCGGGRPRARKDGRARHLVASSGSASLRGSRSFARRARRRRCIWRGRCR